MPSSIIITILIASVNHKDDVLYQEGSVMRYDLAELPQLMHDLQQLPTSKVSDHPYLNWI
jgi:hypothetical protein